VQVPVEEEWGEVYEGHKRAPPEEEEEEEGDYLHCPCLGLCLLNEYKIKLLFLVQKKKTKKKQNDQTNKKTN